MRSTAWLILLTLLVPFTASAQPLDLETVYRGPMTLPWSGGIETEFIRDLEAFGASGLWSQLPPSQRIEMQFSAEGRWIVENKVAAVSTPDRGVEIVSAEEVAGTVVVRYRVAGGASDGAANVHMVTGIPNGEVRFERLADAPLPRGAGAVGLSGRLEPDAARTVAVCHRFSCAAVESFALPEDALERLRRVFDPAPRTAAEERERIAKALGLLELEVGPRAGTSKDAGGWAGNREGASPGNQDCLDESSNTTTYLGLMVRHGLVRFHKPEETKRRGLFATHFSASMREVASGEAFAVDTWFRDNGHPAVILPLADWKKKKEPKGPSRVVDVPLGLPARP